MRGSYGTYRDPNVYPYVRRGFNITDSCAVRSAPHQEEYFNDSQPATLLHMAQGIHLSHANDDKQEELIRSCLMTMAMVLKKVCNIESQQKKNTLVLQGIQNAGVTLQDPDNFENGEQYVDGVSTNT